MLLGLGGALLGAEDDAGGACCWPHQGPLLQKALPVLPHIFHPHVIQSHIQLLQ